MKAGKIGAQIGQWFRIEEIKLNMSTSQYFKTTLKYNLTCIFLSLRAPVLHTVGLLATFWNMNSSVWAIWAVLPVRGKKVGLSFSEQLLRVVFSTF